MERCSYPGCNYLGDIITNHHTLTMHDMRKKDVIARYGKFSQEFPVISSTFQKWIREQCPSVTNYDFEGKDFFKLH